MGVKLEAIKSVVVRNANRTGLVLKKASPQIMFALGLAGIGGTIYLACKATLEIDEVQQETKDKFERINEGRKNCTEEVYPDDKYKKDLATAWIQGAVSLGRLYAPAIGLGITSIGLLTGSHVILTKRNTALMVAYGALAKSFNDYKARVEERLGDEEDYIRHNVHESVSVEETENGPKETVSRTFSENLPSQYAVVWDETHMDGSKNYQWQHSYLDNLWYLQQRQNYCNDMLMARGHIFLNEVYDELQLPRTPDGQLVGWVWGHGDNIIDFGLNRPVNRNATSFSPNPAFMLDFNVDGLVYDLI